MKRIWVILMAVCLVTALGVAAAAAQRAGRDALAGRRWEVAFEDDTDLVWAEGAAVLDGRLQLSRVRVLGPAMEGEGLTSLAVSPDGRLFLGTHGAFLNVYDPADGTFVSLGKPVPSECPT